MELAENNQFHLYIESVRDDIVECSQQLQEKQLAIANALKQSEELTIEAATLKVRMKELEFDEELLKQSEDAAIKEKVLAEKKLMEVGGFERAVRMLQRALREAKQELQDTKSPHYERGEEAAPGARTAQHDPPQELRDEREAAAGIRYCDEKQARDRREAGAPLDVSPENHRDRGRPVADQEPAAAAATGSTGSTESTGSTGAERVVPFATVSATEPVFDQISAVGVAKLSEIEFGGIIITPTKSNEKQLRRS